MGVFGHTRSPSQGGEPGGEYTQNMPSEDFFREPPSIPPHLQKTLLNAAHPTEDPSLLPLPHHVIINHAYSTKHQHDALVLGATHRYKRNSSPPCTIATLPPFCTFEPTCC